MPYVAMSAVAHTELGGPTGSKDPDPVHPLRPIGAVTWRACPRHSCNTSGWRERGLGQLPTVPAPCTRPGRQRGRAAAANAPPDEALQKKSRTRVWRRLRPVRDPDRCGHRARTEPHELRNPLPTHSGNPQGGVRLLRAPIPHRSRHTLPGALASRFGNKALL